MRTAAISAVVLAIAVVVACGGSSSSDGPPADAGVASPGDDAGGDDASPAAPPDAALPDDVDAAILATRPYTMHVPPGYRSDTPSPLVVMFHGYSANGAEQELYFQITATSDARTFLYAYGDGTLDQDGERFWNADDACCDIFHTGVDDVAYFDTIVADARSKYNVDLKRIYVIGHSNGGFMSHRLACDRAGTVAAIVSLAGAVWNDPSKCAPTEPVSIAEVHGDADPTIVYGGGSTPEGTYPSATTTVATWAAKDGCGGAIADTGAPLDLDTGLPGSETKVSAYGGCPSGVDVELWTIQGGTHLPMLAHPTWGDAVWGFLAAHPKP